jgi:hypothetical protein
MCGWREATGYRLYAASSEGMSKRMCGEKLQAIGFKLQDLKE